MGAGEMIGLGVQAASSAGGGKGGGGGGGGGGSGVSPQEAALAQYTYHQGLVEASNRFANTNTGVSTMSTQAASGPRLKKALQLAGLSDKNQAAIGGAQQDLASIQGRQAGQADAASQQQQSSFSDQPGSFSQSSNTTG